MFNSKAPGPVVRDMLLPWILPRVTRPAAMAWLFEHHIDRDGSFAA